MTHQHKRNNGGTNFLLIVSSKKNSTLNTANQEQIKIHVAKTIEN